MHDSHLHGFTNMWTRSAVQQADYSEYCTSVLIDALSYHLIELEFEGKIRPLLANLKKSAATNPTPCNAANPAASPSLPLEALMGVFIIHGVVAAIALLGLVAFHTLEGKFGAHQKPA